MALAAVSVVAYACDCAIFLLHGSPQAKVTVNRYMSVPLKGQKVEFDYLGSVDVPCAVALFPHGGQDPCWYLRRHTNEWDAL